MENSFAFKHGFTVSDEILIAIGLTVVCQFHIENQLSLLIHELTYMDFHKGSALTSGMSFRALSASLSSLVLQVAKEDDDRYKEFTILLGKLQHFEEFRNQISHSIWARSDLSSSTSLRMKTTARRGTGVNHQLEEVEIAGRAAAYLAILVFNLAGKPIDVIDMSQ
jgi:hypothetical protein